MLAHVCLKSRLPDASNTYAKPYLGVKYVAVDFRPTIMFADDDPATLKMAADSLDAAGFRVMKVSDGQVALQEALKRKVALIIMDVSMPHVNGIEACHCLKAMPKTARIPVVLMASKKDPVAKTLGERMNGSVRVLRKPFTAEELVAVAKSLVKSKSLL